MKNKVFYFSILLYVVLVVTACDKKKSQEAANNMFNDSFVASKPAPLQFEEKQDNKASEVYNNKYINNSLQTGTTPYRRYYGGNAACKESGCSQIKVTTPDNSDVLVTIKSNEKVVRHAYIRANSSYTFEIPNGTYQTFFYYGKGWSPEKEMKRADDTTILGGFISSELFGKDSPQLLNNNILEYELIVQQNGNFSQKPSNAMEAL